MRKSFIIHIDSLSVLKKLKDEQAGRLFKAIALFQEEGILPDDELISIVFEPFLNQFLRDSKKYQNIIERNKLNGSKGGRPKNPVGYLGTQENPEKPRKADSDSKNDSVSVSKNVSKKEDNIYSELSEGLKFILQEKLQRNIKSSNWQKEIRLLVENDLAVRVDAVGDVKKVIQAISDHFGEQYFPVIQSAASLREKFAKVEAFLSRKLPTHLSKADSSIKSILEDF